MPTLILESSSARITKGLTNILTKCKILKSNLKNLFYQSFYVQNNLIHKQTNK